MSDAWFMPSVLPPNFPGFVNPAKPKPEMPKNFPTTARIVSHPGDLKEGEPLTKGTHIVWLYAPNETWIPVLKWIANWNTSWNAFTGLIAAAYNATSALKVSFPASQKIAGKWVKRKDYDAKKKGLYFLVEFK